MNIKIIKLTLFNFKCFKGENTFNFDGKDVITISGSNGKGKTTIADAITWCLFGKNYAGQSDFDLKTHDETGKVIPHLDHYVELLISLQEGDAMEKHVTLRRTIKEVWIKKRGAEETVFKNNSTECIVNGELLGPTDYKKYVTSLISEGVFRAITSPTFFTGLHWKEQRSFLGELTKGDAAVDVCGADPDLQALETYLVNNNETIVEYLKHRSYRIKEAKEKLQAIPIRLEEQNKALPQLLDWNTLTADKAYLQTQMADVTEKINLLRTGNGADIKREEIRKQIEEKQKWIDDYVEKTRLGYQDALNTRQKAINAASLKFNEAVNNQRLMEQTIQADERLIERAKETDYEAELQKLRDQWPSSKFIFDKSLTFCPTCGQELPRDQVDKLYDDARTKFNLNREAKIKELNEAAAKVNKEKAEAAEALKTLEEKLAADKAQLDNIKQEINDIFQNKAKLEKLPPIDMVEQVLADDDYYKSHVDELNALKESLSNVTDSEDDKNALDELLQKRSEIDNALNDVTSKLATRLPYDRILALIDGIKEEEKDLVKQLSKLEQEEDLGKQLQNRQNYALEEQVNGHFSITRWRMFHTVNNGGDPFEEPFCECFDLNGTAYHDGLNQAARLNIGLDICNTLCKHYNVSAPIVIDNAESTIDILPTIGQQIRLQVAPTELQMS